MLLTPQDYGQESSLRDEITPPTSFSGEELEVAGKATASTGGSDLASVGKKVKQAYPGYSYMTDEQLGMKFLAKYGNNAPLLKAVTGDVGKPAGAEAVAEVMKQGGSDFINKGKDIASRVAIAESILDSGGVAGYRKLVPLEDLATDKEKDGLADVTSLLSQIERSEKAIGTSPWGGAP